MTRINLARGTIPRMADSPNKRILFTLREGPTFPASLWERFKQTVTARQQGTPVDVLRRLVEGYISQHEQERQP